MSYSQLVTGPFLDNQGPAISAEFLNNIENALATVNSAATDPNITSDGNGLLSVLAMSIVATQVNINGSTSGNIVCYQPIIGGNFKLVIMYFNGYRNNGGKTQGVVVPAPFTQRSKAWSGDLPSTGVQFQKSGTTASVAVHTGVDLGTPSVSITNQALFYRNSFGEILGGWDTMIIPSGGTATVSGVLLIVGG